MPQSFQGKWNIRVIGKNAGFDQRFVIGGAASGNGAYSGTVGTTAIVDGNNWTIRLEWNNGTGSGWRESAVARVDGLLTPIVRYADLGADDNFAAQRDGDFDDLKVRLTSLDPIFDVVQRPFSLDRGTLTMLPDGIFDASQGVQYMGVRVRNSWDREWTPGMRVKIGVSPSCKFALQSQGITVIDSWTAAQQNALQQTVTAGLVEVPRLPIGHEKTVYFKLDCSGAAPGKPEVRFVAQSATWDPNYDAPDRRVSARIFISRSTYDPANRELVAELPEGRVNMRLNRIIVDKAALERAMRHALRNPCDHKPPRPRRRPRHGGAVTEADIRDELKDLLEDLLAGKDVDPCRLRDILDACCRDGGGGGDSGGGTDTDPGDGGLGDGPGGDDWCRFRPFPWIPVEFEYRITPNPAYAGQFGPLAFEDPWWKVILIILAVLLAAASIIYDYVKAGEDPNFVIGTIAAKSGRTSSNVDASIALLNGSRGTDLDSLDAQGDDANNGLPIDGATGGDAAIDRTDNGDRGIADAVPGNVVFKSGARSATTRGVVSSVSLDTNVEGIAYSNQLLINQLAAPNDQPLSQGGDSGSIWVDMVSRRPVGLNFAGPADDSGVNAIANPIRDVVNLLDVHFNA